MTEHKEIHRDWGGKTLVHEAYPVADAATTIVVFPTVMGLSDLERGFAVDLNAKGHSVVIADLYGARFGPAEREQASAAMMALRSDRARLRDLVLDVVDTMRGQDSGARLVAIGFCFGGQCALDLARAGSDVAGVASFHGLFDPNGLPPRPIKAKVIAFHGWDDPLAKPDKVVALGAELTEAGCDWQILALGGVGHAFTNPGATGQMPGIQYDEQAAARSWAAFDGFLAGFDAAP